MCIDDLLRDSVMEAMFHTNLACIGSIFCVFNIQKRYHRFQIDPKVPCTRSTLLEIPSTLQMVSLFDGLI